MIKRDPALVAKRHRAYAWSTGTGTGYGILAAIDLFSSPKEKSTEINRMCQSRHIERHLLLSYAYDSKTPRRMLTGSQDGKRVSVANVSCPSLTAV